MNVPDNVRENLAAIQHEIWAHWMRYLFSVSELDDETGEVIIPRDKARRWERQAETPYTDLSEREKESDRNQADKVIATLVWFAAQPAPVPEDVADFIGACAKQFIAARYDDDDPFGATAQAHATLAWLAAQPAVPEPDWTQAPEWAQWAFLVMYTGHKFLEFRWKFTDILPERDKEWKCYVTPYDAMYYIGPTVELPLGIDWRTTLQRRPAADEDGA